MLVCTRRHGVQKMEGSQKGPCMPPGPYFYHDYPLAESPNSWQQPYLHIYQRPKAACLHNGKWHTEYGVLRMHPAFEVLTVNLTCIGCASACT